MGMGFDCVPTYVPNKQDDKAGMKFDSAKVKWSLVPMSLLEGVAWVYTFGAAKYEANNWKLLNDPVESYYSALHRHLNAWWNDGDYKDGVQFDSELGCHHLLQVVWNALALCWFERKRLGAEAWNRFVGEAPCTMEKLRALRNAKLAEGSTR